MFYCRKESFLNSKGSNFKRCLHKSKLVHCFADQRRISSIIFLLNRLACFWVFLTILFVWQECNRCRIYVPIFYISNFQRSIAMHIIHRFEVLTFYIILEYDVSAKNHIPREHVNGDFHLFSLSIFRLRVHSELFQETPVAVDRKVGLNCIHLVCWFCRSVQFQFRFWTAACIQLILPKLPSAAFLDYGVRNPTS